MHPSSQIFEGQPVNHWSAPMHRALRSDPGLASIFIVAPLRTPIGQGFELWIPSRRGEKRELRWGEKRE
eukprot:scaffold1109_cov153-Pinguiococcus_pyrenoidosus.AAC.1